MLSMALQQRTKEWLLAGSGIFLIMLSLGGLWYWESLKSADAVVLGYVRWAQADLLRYHHFHGVYPGELVTPELKKILTYSGSESCTKTGCPDFAIPFRLNTRIGDTESGSYQLTARGVAPALLENVND